MIPSLENNGIGAKGTSALAAILNETHITNLKCAATPKCFAFANTSHVHICEHSFTFLCPLYFRQKQAHSFVSPKRFLHVFANAHTHPFLTPIYAMLPSSSCATWTEATASVSDRGSSVPPKSLPCGLPVAACST